MSASICIQQVDPRVRVVVLSALPRPDIACPMPTLIGDEDHVILGYYTEVHDWAIVRFVGCQSHALGPPNGESIPEHPLFKHGLGRSDCYEVKPSPWIEAIKGPQGIEMQDPLTGDSLLHCIITFEGSTFECIAQGISVCTIDPEQRMPIDEMIRIWKTPRGH